jgi:dTDP-4-amino-4,6-dideoxygalactose transaminase
VTGPQTTDSDRLVPPIPAARIVFSDADRAEIASRIDAALTGGALTLGDNTRELEAAFAAAHDARFAIAVSSGTAALEIILRSLDVAGREVVVPANTFAATAFAVLAAGATPVFADIDPATASLDVDSVSAVLTDRTAAVIVVHIAGYLTPEMPKLRTLCDEHGVLLVEDAAHAHGCRLDDAYAGSFGVAAAFSFYPTKVITTGEGGVIVTSDERLRDEALSYRDQGKAGFLSNLHTRLGYAWRISELHAAVGVVHLRHLDEFIATRSHVARRYTDGLAALAVLKPVLPDARVRCNHYKYPVLLADGIDRGEFKTYLRTQFQVSLSGEVYETPLHEQPVFSHLSRGPLPGAELFCARHICLPVHSDMTDPEIDRVLEALIAACKEFG